MNEFISHTCGYEDSRIAIPLSEFAAVCRKIATSCSGYCFNSRRRWLHTQIDGRLQLLSTNSRDESTIDHKDKVISVPLCVKQNAHSVRLRDRVARQLDRIM